MERQHLLLILLIIILGGITYIWYQYLNVLPETTGEEPIEFETQVAELERLATVELSVGVLDDPFFQSLEAPPPTAEAASSSVRKGNPFLPF